MLSATWQKRQRTARMAEQTNDLSYLEVSLYHHATWPRCPVLPSPGSRLSVRALGWRERERESGREREREGEREREREREREGERERGGGLRRRTGVPQDKEIKKKKKKRGRRAGLGGVKTY